LSKGSRGYFLHVRRVQVTDQCVSPTVEPYGVLGEVGELVMAAVDVLGVMSSEAARSSHFLDKHIE